MLFEKSFLSSNKRDQVVYWIYAPACKPLGIVHLIHGFGEHSRRYIHMIDRFLQKGYIVTCNDHVGHGATAVKNDTWGDWGDGGFETMMHDEKIMKDIVTNLYPDIPYYMFGHSMGSVIARQFIAKWGDELNGVILCGTTGDFPCQKAMEILEEDIRQGKGNESDQNALLAAMGWMMERIPDAKIGNEWICHDPYIQLDHANDPLDAFTKPCMNKSLLDFLRMVEDVKGEDWAAKVPTSLPIYNIAGSEDPVGHYGEGVSLVSHWLSKTNHHPVTKIYEGYRHEIHNYKDLSDTVIDGILNFIQSCK